MKRLLSRAAIALAIIVPVLCFADGLVIVETGGGGGCADNTIGATQDSNRASAAGSEIFLVRHTFSGCSGTASSLDVIHRYADDADHWIAAVMYNDAGGGADPSSYKNSWAPFNYANDGVYDWRATSISESITGTVWVGVIHLVGTSRFGYQSGGSTPARRFNANIAGASFSGPDGNGEYSASLTIEPAVVFVAQVQYTQGSVGSLGATEWSYSGGNLYLGSSPGASQVAYFPLAWPTGSDTEDTEDYSSRILF